MSDVPPPNLERPEATVLVPSKGGGPPEESKEPVMPPGPNPEKDDKTAGMVRVAHRPRTAAQPPTRARVLTRASLPGSVCSRKRTKI